MRGKSFSWGPIDSRARAMVEAAMEMKGVKEPLYWPLIQSYYFHFHISQISFPDLERLLIQKRPCRVTMWKLLQFFLLPALGWKWKSWQTSVVWSRRSHHQWMDRNFHFWRQILLLLLIFIFVVANFLKCRYSSIVLFLCITICKNSISQFHSDVGAL